MDHREHLPIGAELVGDYRIDGVLGQGGFGITYKAWHLALDTFVAVKEYFPSQLATRDQTLSLRPSAPKFTEMFDWGRRRFLDEAKTLARFRHPSIVRVLHVFEALDTAYMVLEYEDGQSLRDWLDDLGRLPSQEELDGIVSPLLDALSEMHAADFIHRDIAPDNIIVRSDGSPVLLDFGAARQAIAAETKALTGIVKSGYSPPEQYLTDAGLQGPWTDIYALGATLYQVVTGAAPPEAPARHIDDTYVSAATSTQGKYRASFLAAIDLALKLKMGERPQSAQKFQQALSGASPSSPATPPQPASLPRNRSGTMRWAAAALIAGVCVIAGYLIYDTVQVDRQRTQTLADNQARRVALLAQEAEEKTRKAQRALRMQEEAARQRAVVEKRRKAEMLKQADVKAWQIAADKNTIEAFSQYVSQFPAGAYVAKAQARITALVDAARQREERKRVDVLRRADDLAWREAKRLDTRLAYRTYLKTHPDGVHRTAALAKAEALQRADGEAWLDAVGKNTPDAYRQYLSRISEGDYAEEARRRIKALVERAQRQGDERKRADAARGSDEPVPSEPELDLPVLTINLQRELARVGCEPGSADGVWGARGRGALVRLNKFANLKLDTTQPTQAALDKTKVLKGRIYPRPKPPKVTTKKKPAKPDARKARTVSKTRKGNQCQRTCNARHHDCLYNSDPLQVGSKRTRCRLYRQGCLNSC